MAATGRRLTYLTSRQILRWGLRFRVRERKTFVHNSMITCGRWAASRIPRQGQKASVLTLVSGLIGCPVTVSTSVSISLPGPGGGEHFQALWRLSEAAEPQGLSECGWCLHEVRFSLVALGFFCCCSNLVLTLDKYILCMCNYVGRFRFSLRRPCWRIFSQIY